MEKEKVQQVFRSDTPSIGDDKMYRDSLRRYTDAVEAFVKSGNTFEEEQSQEHKDKELEMQLAEESLEVTINVYVWELLS